MLLDEALFFAVDLDKTGWRDDAIAFLETCRTLDLDAALEQFSRDELDELLAE